MAESPSPRTVVVSIDSYRPAVGRPEPPSGQLRLFETAPAPSVVDRTARPLTREKIAHRQRMLSFLTKAR